MSSQGIFKRIRLGDDVLTGCGKCKEERVHQVVALNSAGQIERVICRTCQGNHLYRNPQARSKPATQRARRAGQPQAEENLLPSGPLRSYSPADSYTTGEMISHPKFGRGRIVEARTGKIDVKFGGELRTLLHAG